jgi:hypothetical protein
LVLRYKNDGTLDNSFSEDGIGRYTTGGNGLARSYGLAFKTDGEIVVTGSSSLQDNSSDYALITLRIIGR